MVDLSIKESLFNIMSTKTTNKDPLSKNFSEVVPSSEKNFSDIVNKSSKSNENDSVRKLHIQNIANNNNSNTKEANSDFQSIADNSNGIIIENYNITVFNEVFSKESAENTVNIIKSLDEFFLFEDAAVSATKKDISEILSADIFINQNNENFEDLTFFISNIPEKDSSYVLPVVNLIDPKNDIDQIYDFENTTATNTTINKSQLNNNQPIFNSDSQLSKPKINIIENIENIEKGFVNNLKKDFPTNNNFIKTPNSPPLVSSITDSSQENTDIFNSENNFKENSSDLGTNFNEHESLNPLKISNDLDSNNLFKNITNIEDSNDLSKSAKNLTLTLEKINYQKVFETNSGADVKIEQINNHEDHITVKLSPEKLGAVDFRLEIQSNGNTKLIITADNREALAILKENIAVLENELKNIGINTGETPEFNLREGGSGSQNTREEKQNHVFIPSEDKLDEISMIKANQSYNSTMNIYELITENLGFNIFV